MRWRRFRQDGADFAVLPIENSSAGAVVDLYDILTRYSNSIVAETFLPVNHALLGTADSHEEQIQTVYSHPQALMQSSAYLNSHRDWKQISMENTAVAARKVLEDGDPTQAAVASEIAWKAVWLEGVKTIDSEQQRKYHPVCDSCKGSGIPPGCGKDQHLL